MLHCGFTFDVFNLEPKESLISAIYNAAMVKLAFKQSPCFNSCTVCLQRETEWRAALNIAAHYPEFRKPPSYFFFPEAHGSQTGCWCVWHLHSCQPQELFFWITRYLKKKETEGGQRSTSIKNVFCFETIKSLPAWLTPTSAASPPGLT